MSEEQEKELFSKLFSMVADTLKKGRGFTLDEQEYFKKLLNKIKEKSE